MKKRCTVLLLIALMLMTTLVPVRTASALTLTTGRIVGDNIAFRKTASTKGKLIARLDEGTVVRILEANVNAEWYKAEHADKVGYINRMYVNIDLSMPSYQLGYKGTVVNCNESVRVRSTASISGKELGKAAKGTQLDVTQAYYTPNWHQVKYEDKTGYISATYLSLATKVDDDYLTDLTITGGSLSPRFSPHEYGYVLTATSDTVQLKATANKGVKVSIGSTGIGSAKYTIKSGNSKTIRISVDGKVRYSIYLVRDVLTVGTWNIKRGNDSLVEQGWLIGNEHPDILGVQEVYVDRARDVNNLLSIRTREAQNTSFVSTVDYSSGGRYGIGQVSKFKPVSTEQFALPFGSYEPRTLQKVVYSINGKKVSVYNTHFTWESADTRKKQFAEVVRIMDADENPYRILTGDFNAKEAEFAALKKNYKIVNTSDTKFYDYSYKRINVNQIDNIIVSKNITVLNARAIPTTLSDHYPLFAFLSLK